MLHTVRFWMAPTCLITMVSCLLGGIVPYQPEPSLSDTLPLVGNETDTGNQSIFSHTQAYSLRKYVPMASLLGDAANSTFNFYNDSKFPSHGDRSTNLKMFHRFTTRTRSVVRNAFWRVRNIANRVRRSSQRHSGDVSILALFHDYVVNNGSIANSSGISDILLSIPTVSPVALSSVPSSSLLDTRHAALTDPPPKSVHEGSNGGEQSLPSSQPFGTKIHQVRSTANDVPHNMHYWSAVNALPSPEQHLTKEKNRRITNDNHLKSRLDTPSIYIGRRLSVTHRDAHFAPGHVVGKLAMEHYASKPTDSDSIDMGSTANVGTRRWSYGGDEDEVKGFPLHSDNFVDRTAMSHQSFEYHEGIYGDSSPQDPSANHGGPDGDFSSRLSGMENGWVSSAQSHSRTNPEESRNNQERDTNQKSESTWTSRDDEPSSENDETEGFKREEKASVMAGTTPLSLGKSSTIHENVNSMNGDNMTQLSTMVYKIAMTENVKSLAAVPCREVMEWMPNVVQRLDSHVDGFEFFCVDILLHSDVKSKSSTMTAVSSNSNAVDEDLRNAFGGDLSGGFIQMGMNEIDERFPKGLDLVVTWMGSHQWGVKDTWRFAKGLRRSQTRLWLLSNDAGRANRDNDDDSFNEGHALNVRKAPLLFNEPTRVIGKVSEDSKRQLLLYDMARVRDNF